MREKKRISNPAMKQRSYPVVIGWRCELEDHATAKEQDILLPTLLLVLPCALTAVNQALYLGCPAIKAEWSCLYLIQICEASSLSAKSRWRSLGERQSIIIPLKYMASLSSHLPCGKEPRESLFLPSAMQAEKFHAKEQMAVCLYL